MWQKVKKRKGAKTGTGRYFISLLGADVADEECLVRLMAALHKQDNRSLSFSL